MGALVKLPPPKSEHFKVGKCDCRIIYNVLNKKYRWDVTYHIPAKDMTFGGECDTMVEARKEAKKEAEKLNGD